MRPLPPFTVRPLKRRDVRKTVLATTIRDVAEELPQSSRASRLAVRPGADRAKPQLKVLDRE